MIDIDHRRAATLDQIREQPQLGGEIVRHAWMIIEMIAADIGKAGRHNLHAIEPMLVEAVRGGLDGEMGHALLGQRIELLMQRDRVGRGQGSVDLTLARDQPDGADARRLVTERSPDLAREGGDRGLPAGSGDGSNNLRLVGEEFGRGERERMTGVVDLHEGNMGGKRCLRHPLRHDGRRARGERLCHEPQAVVLGTRDRHEQVARLDGAAVRADAVELEPRKARVADGIHGEQVLELHE